MYLLLEETEKQAVRRALIEERGRFCTFITFLQPVVVGRSMIWTPPPGRGRGQTQGRPLHLPECFLGIVGDFTQGPAYLARQQVLQLRTLCLNLDRGPHELPWSYRAQPESALMVREGQERRGLTGLCLRSGWPGVGAWGLTD